MLNALTLALARIFDRALLPIWLKSMGVTVLACLLLGYAGWRGLLALTAEYVANPEVAATIATLAVLIGGWLLWRIVALAVLQFFADAVVQAIEARDYPDMAASARKLGLREEAGRAMAGAGRAVLFNLLALPVALVLLVTGIGAPIVFLLVNAVLLGRELQDMVWLRHRPNKQAPAPLGPVERLALGGVTAFLLTVPVVNFIAPFLGAACAVHLIHRKGTAST